MSNDNDHNDGGNDNGHEGGDYEVGYGKPPKHSRFKPGQSGNKKGRPKKSSEDKGLSDLLKERLEQPVDLMLGGRQVRMPAKEAIARQIVNGAIKGDLRALQALERVLGGSLGRSSDQIRTSPSGNVVQAESDAAVIERFLNRQERQMPADEDDDEGSRNE